MKGFTRFYYFFQFVGISENVEPCSKQPEAKLLRSQAAPMTFDVMTRMLYNRYFRVWSYPSRVRVHHTWNL
jgi:hypothetical protein